MQIKIQSSLVFIVVLVMLSSIVFSVPETPTSITTGTPETRSYGTTGSVVQAQSGNITEVTVDGTRVTYYWQGYYGNITGTVVLDDGDNFTMYDWGLAIPVGEVYAANQTVASWDEIMCINITYNRPGYNCSLTETDGANPECFNITELEDHFGIESTDKDGVNETFKDLYNITIGTNTLYSCPGTNIYVNSSNQSDYWREVILTVNNSETIIFASIIENDQFGFKNQSTDFQMIVGESDASGASSYVFYVELT